MVAPELELHVDQHDVALVEVLAQERVHRSAVSLIGGQLVRRGQAEEADVPVVDHRVAERVVLVEVLEDRLGSFSPSSRPRRFARLPAMMFRATTSTARSRRRG